MKYLLILAIVFISLCAGLPIELPFQTPVTQQPGISTIDSIDLYLSVQTIPLEVRQGRTLTLLFELRNKNTFDLENVIVEVYDTCIFDPPENKKIRDKIERGEGTIGHGTGIIKPNQTETWSWEWTAGPTELDKDCEIKFKTEYTADFSLSQDIAVLSKSEYKIRQLQGTLQDIPVQSSSSNTPLKITLTFPETQPFLEDTSGYTMLIDYYNIGNGFITVNKADIERGINVPGNIDNWECANYFTSGEPTLRFINNKALRTTCSFKTKEVDQPIDIKTLSITTNYKYLLDNSISVRVTR